MSNVKYPKIKTTLKKEKQLEIKEVAKYEITTDTQIITGKEKWFHLVLNGTPTKYEFNLNKQEIRDMTTGKILAKKINNDTNKDGNGYIVSILTLKPGVTFSISYHRIVAALFIPIPAELASLGYKQIHLVPNHKDGNKQNNDVNNLEWTTIQGNTIDAFDKGLCKSSQGENSHLAKITEKEAIQICEMLQDGKSTSEISKIIGCSVKTIQHIKSRECWKSVSKNYTFPTNDNKPYVISVDILHKVCKAIESGKKSDTEIAKKYGISRKYVNDIRLHKRRTDISCRYKF